MTQSSSASIVSVCTSTIIQLLFRECLFNLTFLNRNCWFQCCNCCECPTWSTSTLILNWMYMTFSSPIYRITICNSILIMINWLRFTWFREITCIHSQEFLIRKISENSHTQCMRMIWCIWIMLLNYFIVLIEIE